MMKETCKMFTQSGFSDFPVEYQLNRFLAENPNYSVKCIACDGTATLYVVFQYLDNDQ